MQQVQLYLDEFRPKNDWLSLNHLCVYAVVLVFCLIIFSVTQRSNLGELEKQLNEKQTQLNDLTTQINQLKIQAQQPESQALKNQVVLLRQQVLQRERILSVIDKQNLGNEKGFSELFKAISKASSSDVSVQQFTFYLGGKSAALTGEAKRPESVPQFLNNLLEQSEFSQTYFGLLKVEEETAKSRYAFSIGRQLDTQLDKQVGNQEKVTRNSSHDSSREVHDE